MTYPNAEACELYYEGYIDPVNYNEPAVRMVRVNIQDHDRFYILTQRRLGCKQSESQRYHTFTKDSDAIRYAIQRYDDLERGE